MESHRWSFRCKLLFSPKNSKPSPHQRFVMKHWIPVATLIGVIMPLNAEVDLRGRKDHVISAPRRAAILETAESLLQLGDRGEFQESIDAIDNPYVFEQLDVPHLEFVEESGPEEVSELIYDDRAVLDLIVSKLATEIRGTISMGDAIYIQLKSGALMQMGSTFPAKLPQNPDQDYEVTLVGLIDGNLTLRLGSAEHTYPLKPRGAGVSKSLRMLSETD